MDLGSIEPLLGQKLRETILSGRVIDDAILDIKVLGERREGTEDQKLKPEEDPMRPVKLPEASIVRHVTGPYPPHKSEDAKKRGQALKQMLASMVVHNLRWDYRSIRSWSPVPAHRYR